MPEVDGLKLVKFFSAHQVTKQIPLIVLSSTEEPKTKAEAFAVFHDSSCQGFLYHSAIDISSSLSILSRSKQIVFDRDSIERKRTLTFGVTFRSAAAVWAAAISALGYAFFSSLFTRRRAACSTAISAWSRRSFSRYSRTASGWCSFQTSGSKSSTLVCPATPVEKLGKSPHQRG
jgi:hypothetical protein